MSKEFNIDNIYQKKQKKVKKKRKSCKSKKKKNLLKFENYISIKK